jgi:hypothetical protein
VKPAVTYFNFKSVKLIFSMNIVNPLLAGFQLKLTANTTHNMQLNMAASVFTYIVVSGVTYNTLSTTMTA